MPKSAPIDKNQLITDQLIASIEKGVIPWKRPWKSGIGNNAEFQNIVTKHIYSGANPLWILISNLYNGYESPYFCTFLQAKQNAWKIRKDSKSCWIRFASSGTKEVETENGDINNEQFFFAKWSGIFSIDCIDDSISQIKIADSIEQTPTADIPDNPDLRIVSIDNFIAGTKASIVHTGSRACYLPSSDEIRLPQFEQFTSADKYYSTTLHELGHWSGHSARLNREGITKSAKHGSPTYAFEELIAELSSAFVASELFPEYVSIDLEHHASYLDSWLNALKSDKTAFFRAVSKAQQASKFLLDLSSKNLAVENAEVLDKSGLAAAV